MIRQVLLYLPALFVLAGCGGENSQEIGSSNPDVTGSYRGEANRTWQSIEEAGVEAKIVEFNETTENGNEIPHTRRYLRYVPDTPAGSPGYPLLFVLHGANVNPEISRTYDSMGSFERLADQHGFVVVYGNGDQPVNGANQDAFTAHSSWWAIPRENRDYLKAIWQQLEAEGIHIDSSRRYLVGLSNGAGIINQISSSYSEFVTTHFAGIGLVAGPAPWFLDATARHYSQTEGIEYSNALLDEPLLLSYCEDKVDTELSPMREAIKNLDIIHFYSENDGAFGDTTTYREQMQRGIALNNCLRGAKGYDDSINVTQYEDQIIEGGNCEGLPEYTTSTCDSRIQQEWYQERPGVGRLSVISSDRSGHGWPYPEQYHESVYLGWQGLRNQDIDLAEKIWEFFAQSE
ncbi:alpha/beta hydrolase family esterase [Aliagarivorans marinus]|uniref:alpha/beta hydrolase family esterase n=1 Tax=Aliagarivorans marinus TaxID=561965 RepID=UPI0003FD3A8B|nr:PHB depolymerase family esterase [Aliagarivorans marinus]